MKILHVYAQKPDHTGSGVYIQNLIKNLHSQGISNYLICATSVSDDIDKDLLQALDKIDVINFDTKDLPFPIPGMSDDMPYKSSIYSKLSKEELNLWQNAFYNSLKKAKAYKPDKIIVHHLWGLVPLVLDNFDSKLVTAICHGTDMRQLKLFKHLNNTNIDFIENILSSIQKLNDIIALNDIQKQAIINNYKVDSHKIRTIGLGFNPKLFFPEKLSNTTNNEFEISYVGKITPQKGVGELISAFKHLQAKNKYNIRLSLIGSADSINLDYYKSLSKTHESHIHFLGALKQNVMAPYLRNSKVFVLPSYYEGASTVTLEALASGNRIVVNEIPTIKPWIPQKAIESGRVLFVNLPKLIEVDKPCPSCLDNYIEELKDTIDIQLEKTISDLNFSSKAERDRLEIYEILQSKYSWTSISNQIINI